MANYKIEEIEGIGPVLGTKFREVGIKNTGKLLNASISRKHRELLADALGIDDKRILKFANMADLLRIKGVGPEFAELLEAAGVDTVPELAQRNAKNLTAKMQEINDVKRLTRRVPYQVEVEKWITEAKDLPRILEY